MGVRASEVGASSRSKLLPSDRFFPIERRRAGDFEHREAASTVQNVQIEGSRQSATGSERAPQTACCPPADCLAAQLQPLVPPQVSHLKQVPLRTMV